MRGMLEGAIAGVLAAPAYAGATGSANVSQPQSPAPIRLSTRNTCVTFDDGRVKRLRRIIPSGAGCIAGLSEFDLRYTQHIEYIFHTLVRPRFIREFSVRGLRGCGSKGGAACMIRRVFFCAALRLHWP
jgi:hypothetical protein